MLTKSQATDLAALIPSNRPDLLAAIAAATAPDTPEPILPAISRTTSSFDLDRPTAPIPPETMAELVASTGRARTVDL